MFRFQQIFSFFLVSVAIFFSCKLALHVGNYLLLRSQASAQISEWSLEELNDRWRICAHYFFENKEKKWSGTTTFQNDCYLNDSTALKVLNSRAKQSWKVWFNPSNPERSSLEKIFPWGLLARTAVCWGVLAYFQFFRKYFKNSIK